MQKHFNNQFNQNNNNGQANRQQFMQQMRDTTPHNFIQKTENDSYGQYQNTGYYNGYQQQPQQINNFKPYQNYGVSAN